MYLRFLPVIIGLEQIFIIWCKTSSSSFPEDQREKLISSKKLLTVKEGLFFVFGHPDQYILGSTLTEQTTLLVSSRFLIWKAWTHQYLLCLMIFFAVSCIVSNHLGYLDATQVQGNNHIYSPLVIDKHSLVLIMLKYLYSDIELLIHHRR